MNIFKSLKVFEPSQLVVECEKMLQLSQNFIEYAANEENEKIEREAINEMEIYVEELKEPISQYNGSQWTLAQSNKIAEVKKFFFVVF